MKLKDYLSSDMDTFLNQDEFAEYHNINGKEVLAVVDDNVLQERSRRDVGVVGTGIYESEMVVFVKETDLGYRPVISQHFELDGELYLVKNCSGSGMLEITLGANEA